MNSPNQAPEVAPSTWTSEDSGFSMNAPITHSGKTLVRKVSPKSLVFATMALSAMMPFAAQAQATAPPQQNPGVQVDGYCDPQVLTVLVEQYKAQQNDMDQSLNPLFKSIKDVADDSWSKMSSCVDLNWPNLSFQRPTMDQIIKGIAQVAVRQVCSEAREAVSGLNSAMHNSYYMNTRIPGVPSIGVSTYGGQSGGFTVNGTPASTPGLYNPPPRR